MKQKAEERYKRNRNIYINTCNCRYELDTLQYVIGKNGFREVSNHPGQGHILWYGAALRDHDLDTIKSNQDCIFNRYPLMDHFAKKNILSVILSRLQRFFPIDFNFLPEYFLLPDEINEFEEHIRDNEDQTFIAKPSNGKAGRGIRLLKSFKELPKNAYE